MHALDMIIAFLLVFLVLRFSKKDVEFSSYFKGQYVKLENDNIKETCHHMEGISGLGCDCKDAE